MASIPIGSDRFDLGGNDHSLGEGESEVTETFYGAYLSLSMRIVKIVADGDCGLDVMCLMIGWPREVASRRSLRCELCAFALEHVGNRALVAAMHTLAELREHLGMFELEASATAVSYTHLTLPTKA